MDLTYEASGEATSDTGTPMAANTVAFHHLSDTFRRKTLRAMIQDQAPWTEDGLKRLGLLK